MKNTKLLQKKVSFFEAIQIIKEIRKKPRSNWTKKERFDFKGYNFQILSRKRINKIFESLNSFKKLSNKSHYKFYLNDLVIIRELLVSKLNETLCSFFKKLEVMSSEDILKIKSYLQKILNENDRLKRELSQYKKELNIYKKHAADEQNKFLNKILKLEKNKKKTAVRYKSINKELNRSNEIKFTKLNVKNNSPEKIDELLNHKLFNLINTQSKKFKL